MQYQKAQNAIILRLDPGDELISSIKELAQKEGIKTAIVSGIGAANEVEVGCYAVGEKTYHSTIHEGEMEIIGLAGNLSTMNGEVYLHVHTSLAHENGTVYGGHLNKARISATAEIFIQPIDHVLERQYDDNTGLNILRFVEQ